jgi:hypothetical protein
MLTPEALCCAFMGQILENKKSIEKLKDVISMNASELSEVSLPVCCKKNIIYVLSNHCLSLVEQKFEVC